MPDAPYSPQKPPWPQRAISDQDHVRALSLEYPGRRRSPTYQLVGGEAGSIRVSIARRVIHVHDGDTARVRRRFGRLRVVAPDGRVLVRAVPRLGEVWDEAGERAELVLTAGREGSVTWRRAELQREATTVAAAQIVYTHEVGDWDKKAPIPAFGAIGAKRPHSARFDGAAAHAQETSTLLVAVCTLLALGRWWTMYAPRIGAWTQTKSEVGPRRRSDY